MNKWYRDTYSVQKKWNNHLPPSCDQATSKIVNTRNKAYCKTFRLDFVEEYVFNTVIFGVRISGLSEFPYYFSESLTYRCFDE